MKVGKLTKHFESVNASSVVKIFMLKTKQKQQKPGEIS